MGTWLIAGSPVVPVWVVYRSGNDYGVLYSVRRLCCTDGHNRHYHPWIWNLAVCHCKCRHEFREAFVRVVSWKIDKDFGNVKIVFDVTSAARSLILSLLFFDFKIARTRKGTIIFALMTGVVVKYFNGKLRKPVDSEC